MNDTGTPQDSNVIVDSLNQRMTLGTNKTIFPGFFLYGVDANACIIKIINNELELYTSQ